MADVSKMQQTTSREEGVMDMFIKLFPSSRWRCQCHNGGGVPDPVGRSFVPFLSATNKFLILMADVCLWSQINEQPKLLLPPYTILVLEVFTQSSNSRLATQRTNYY